MLQVTENLYRHTEEQFLCHSHSCTQYIGATVVTMVGVPPQSSCVSVVVSFGRTLHPPCLLMVVRGLGGSLASYSLPEGSSGHNVAYHCWCVNVCMTDCSVKHFGVLKLDKALYKCRPFTIYSHLVTFIITQVQYFYTF
ncbi:hypothetical protein AMECASPLE_031086 [Ameca splendens]|uniref:Uncharacterized protein n=1 Tax=Ameca splendens TaxID=208324 RepID=A0ABV1ACJ5_9TELE